jgi:hypothetical protein
LRFSKCPEDVFIVVGEPYLSRPDGYEPSLRLPPPAYRVLALDPAFAAALLWDVAPAVLEVWTATSRLHEEQCLLVAPVLEE